MPERSLDGISFINSPEAQQSIARASAQATAFIGRTLRGPLNYPIRVRSFADFQQVFGGLWQPSPLSYAVEQFFEQGGREAIIVRVANGAAPTTLSLPCEDRVLKLEARAPGTREFLRASVDYDHVPADDRERFNLVVQRVRSPGSERVELQETFRSLSIDPESPRFVGIVLLESELVRVKGEVPRVRPNKTAARGATIGYVNSNPDGDDGRAITDYDVIGSKPRKTGLSALDAISDIAFIYIPPLSRTSEVGVSTLVAASQYCRERRAILIADPLAQWSTPREVTAGLKDLGFFSDHATMFFPRIIAMDKLRGRAEVFGNGGAVAGLLSRTGDAASAALSPWDIEPLLRAGAKLANEVASADRWALAAHGVNVLQTVRSPDRNRPALRTLACGASTSADGSYLSQQRFVLYVLNAIANGTRWCAASPRDRHIWQRVTKQARAFLEELRINGAFTTVERAQAYWVICDIRLNVPTDAALTLKLLVQFAARRAGQYHSYLIEHSPIATHVKPVVVNRIEADLVVSDELKQEITIKLTDEEASSAIGMTA
ncbi:MAG TPA: hypothetical protein VFS47_09535 [Steroidobacteraceae bacterium]|nr:hypothetical protein [Steroidobacteraceae bacterium]